MNRDVSNGKKFASFVVEFDLDFPSEMFQSTRPFVCTSLRFRRFYKKRVDILGQNPKTLAWSGGKSRLPRLKFLLSKLKNQQTRYEVL